MREVYPVRHPNRRNTRRFLIVISGLAPFRRRDEEEATKNRPTKDRIPVEVDGIIVWSSADYDGDG